MKFKKLSSLLVWTMRSKANSASAQSKPSIFHFPTVSPPSNWFDSLPPENSLKLTLFPYVMYNPSHFKSITNPVLELFIFLHCVNTENNICFFHGYWKPSTTLGRILPTGTVYETETSVPLESLSSRMLKRHRSQTSNVLSR